MSTDNHESAETQPATSIDQLPQSFGFIETDELNELHEQLISAMNSGSAEVVKELVSRYRSIGEQIVEQQLPDKQQRAATGLDLVVALIRRESGRTGAYLNDLRDVLDNINYGTGDYGDTGSIVAKSALAALPEFLGFTQTPEMIEIKNKIVEAHNAGDIEMVRQLHIKYARQSKEIIDVQYHDDDVGTRQKRQVGKLTTEILMFREAGLIDEYLEELKSTYMHASAAGIQEVTPILASLIEEAGMKVPYGIIFNNGWEDFFNRSEYRKNAAKFYRVRDATVPYYPDEEWVRDRRELTRRWVLAIERAAIREIASEAIEELDELDIVSLATMTVYQKLIENGVWEEEGVSFRVDSIDGVELGEIIDIRII